MSSKLYFDTCDTFFVEGAQEDRSSKTMAQLDSDIDSISHEERQLIIAENLSTELAVEYGNDVVLHMIRMEVSDHLKPDQNGPY